MPKIAVVYASRHGGTAGIAEKIGEVLRSEGAEVIVSDAEGRPDPAGFDAYVVGSGVYSGSWLKEGIDYLEKNQAMLATRPTWLFSSGPLPNPSKPTKDDLLTQALGPEDGIGSGGRKRVAALAEAIHAHDHRVFLGAFDPNDPPRSMQERLIRMMPAVKNVLPAGDFREWAAIEAWAREIAADVTGGVPVG